MLGFRAEVGLEEGLRAPGRLVARERERDGGR